MLVIVPIYTVLAENIESARSVARGQALGPVRPFLELPLDQSLTLVAGAGQEPALGVGARPEPGLSEGCPAVADISPTHRNPEIF